MSDADIVFEQAVVHVVLAMIAADGELETNEVERARRVVRAATDSDISAAEIESAAGAVLDGRVRVHAALSEAAPGLRPHERAMLVRVAADIASSDGTFADAEMDGLRRIAASLGIADDELRGILGRR